MAGQATNDNQEDRRKFFQNLNYTFNNINSKLKNVVNIFLISHKTSSNE
jgi:hypothetical protein